jgi:hypothetical protein
MLQFRTSPIRLAVAPAMPVSPWRASDNGCRYRAVSDDGSVSPRELLFGHALEVVDKPAVGVTQLPQDVGERKVSFLLCHLSIEGIIDAAVRYIPRRPTSLEDQRQILQRFLLPCGDVRKGVLYRPVARDARFRQLRV